MILNHRTCEKPLPLRQLIAEIGFGRGDFLIFLSRKYPNRIIAGFEVSGISIEKAERKLRKRGITNVILIQLDAYQGFYFILAEESVREIYLNFPDPWFKKKHHRRRITSHRNLLMFASRMERGGKIYLRTDYHPLIEFTFSQARSTGLFKILTEDFLGDLPETKYGQKAVKEGRKVYTLTLELIKKPPYTPPRIMGMFNVKVRGVLEEERLANKSFKIGRETVLKTYGVIRTKDGFLVEALLSENGFVQRFFISVKENNGNLIFDVSPFSEVIRTPDLYKAIKTFAEFVVKQ